MTYGHTTDDQTALAHALRDKMAECGFNDITLNGTREEVYERAVDGTEGRIVVRVYTTIEGGRCRDWGRDAIRVCAVYKSRKDNKERGIASADHRVNRTGKVADIVDRTHGRMREVYKKALHPVLCKCGAPKFTSKKGNAVCADLCWLDKKATPAVSAATKRRAWTRSEASVGMHATIAGREGVEGVDYAADEANREDAPTGPPAGSWAATARMMAGPNPSDEEGEFWDRWKDEMKEAR